MKNTTGTTERIIMAIIAITAWFALGLQLSLTLKTTTATGFSTLKTVTNFFSYFTVLCNILVAVCLSSALLNPRSYFSKIAVQSAIAVYIFIVGLVYNLVLRGIWSPGGMQLVADNLLHVVVPIIYMIYWVIFTPKRTLNWKNMFPWLVFPGIYLIYSLLRGPFANWYPYPFVDVAQFGYGKVALNSFFVLVAILAVSSGVIAYNRSGKK